MPRSETTRTAHFSVQFKHELQVGVQPLPVGVHVWSPILLISQQLKCTTQTACAIRNELLGNADVHHNCNEKT